MADDGPRSKVQRLINEYDLTGMGAELEDRWTRSEDRFGIRQLAHYFNRRLLEISVQSSDSDPLDGEIENTYHLLTDEAVSSGVQTETRNRLTEAGIDVDKLQQDFVSKQAIHTYLSKVRQVEPPDRSLSTEEKREQDKGTIQALRQRLITVTERILTNLKKTNRMTIGEFTVLVNVRVHCVDCGSQYPVVDLLDSGTCDCPPDRE